MESTSPQPSRLSIARLHNVYLAPGNLPAPDELRQRCDGAISSHLPEALAGALHRSLPAQDPGVWFVRRLAVDFTVNTDLHSADLPEVWAREIARAWSGMLASHELDADVLHFPNHAAYLAHFLLDLAEGFAWGKWHYRSFAGLRLLPVSAALRTAVCAEASVGLGAMSLLPPHQVATVIRALSATDAERVLAHLGSGPAAGEVDAFQLLDEVWEAGLVFPPVEEERRALTLFLAASRNNQQLAGASLRQSVVASVRVARLIDQAGAELGYHLAVLGQGSLAALYDAFGARDAATLESFLQCEPECRQRLLIKIAGRTGAGMGDRKETRFTSFGGMFLLLPLLDELPLRHAVQGWPEPEEWNALSLARLLILAKCLGGARSAACLRDPVVCDWMQIPPRVTAQGIARWLARLSFKNISGFLETLVGWHKETRAAPGDVLSFWRAAHRGAPVGILLDQQRELWLSAFSLPEGRTRLPWLRHLGKKALQPSQVLCDDSYAEEMAACFPGAAIQPLPESDRKGSPGSRGLASDVIYLSHPRELRGSRHADHALSVAAQGVLRSFAWKLPGFSKSSLAHLHRNFLDCSAAVEERPEQTVVHLTRSPLHLVLGMTGLNRRSYGLSWAPDRWCAVFPED
jgi:hypothetical protein